MAIAHLKSFTSFRDAVQCLILAPEVLNMSSVALTPVYSPGEVKGYVELIATNYYGTASFTILLWDHVITFADEVEYIWTGNKGPVVYLFYLNRYLTPLGFVLNLFAYLSPVWTPERCNHFVRYEGAMILIAICVTGLMMMLRINAIYCGNRYVVSLLLAILAVEVGVTSWLLSGAHAVPHPAGIHGCSMIFADTVGNWPSATAWLPLLYDTAVLLLTLAKTLSVVRSKMAGHIVKNLLRDGILYYSVMFVANLILAIMIVTAPPGIRNIGAQFEQLITVTMMSRITLNLRKNASPGMEEIELMSTNHALSTVFPHGDRPSIEVDGVPEAYELRIDMSGAKFDS